MSDRYCINEKYKERVVEDDKEYRFTRVWDFEYSDGTFEQLIMREVLKK